jgi:phosphoribosyl 1,2-cyclic phosphodiesterase
MLMKIGVTALGSGSRGNAFVIHCDNTGIMIDGGFSRKLLIERMKEGGIKPEIVKAMLLTHEHDDHAKGCRVFCDHYDIPLCTTYRTAKYLGERNKIPQQVMEFIPGSRFELEGFTINPFSVRHDAIEPVGFEIKRGKLKIGVATDLGSLDQLATMRLRDSNMLILESNYDLDMLRNSSRPLHLKRRIMGRHGHLDNRDALSALPELVTAKTKIIYLVHVSAECNNHDLVKIKAKEQLNNMGRDDILLEVIRQSKSKGVVYLTD